MEEAIKKAAKINATYKWLSIVDKLAGQDVTKYEQVYSLNFISCLNSLSYWHNIEAVKNNKR